MVIVEKEVKEFDENIESDHELILLLKKEIEELTVHISQTERNLVSSEQNLHETSEQLSIHEKLSAQHALLRHIFSGVIVLVICMWTLVFVGWVTGQEAIEREMAFFERIILVFIGIVGGAISSFFDVRNFTLAPVTKNNGNGNNINSKSKDTD